MPILLENRTGQLVVFRLSQPLVFSDWPQVRAEMARVIEPLEQCVFCVDWRELSDTQDPEVLAEIEKLLSSDNAKLLRSGILIEPSSFMLQFSQIVIKAAHPNRRVVYTKDAMTQWLEPELGPDEREAMRAFMDEV
ncbi:MAG: hypothetical protein AAF658_18680 [Myxococcota bacterium]